jgi:hypothetical protein
MDIRDRKIEDAFYECDECKYDRGFHSSFLKDISKYRVILICPECGTKYDVGWKITI